MGRLSPGGETQAMNPEVIPPSNDDATRRRKSSCWRLVTACLLLAIIGFVIYDSQNNKVIEKMAFLFFDWVQENPVLGFGSVILVYAVATVCFFPGSLLTVGVAFTFRSAFDSFSEGLLISTVTVFLGASLGALCSFLLGRHLFRDCVTQLAASYPIFQAIDRALERHGLKIMILLRLSPLVPFNALDYICGVTSVSLWNYALALVGLLPGTIMFCYLGATASSIYDGSHKTEEDKGVHMVVIIFGLIFAILGTLVTGYYSKRELDQMMAEEGSVDEVHTGELLNDDSDNRRANLGGPIV